MANSQEDEAEASTEIRIQQTEVKVTYEDSANKFRKVEVGTPRPDSEHKVLLLVGESGAGKSTLINGIWIYIKGLAWNDNLRFKLIKDVTEDQNQAHSQTDWITAYTIHLDPHSRAEYTLTIIDTPGFSSGLQRDSEIANMFRHFFNACNGMGIDKLDAVGFVVNSALPRLTVHQIHSFDSILSLFGNDVANSIFMLLTFADGQKPRVLSSIDEASVPYKTYIKINNCALFVGKIINESEEDINEIFWGMTFSGLKYLLDQLGSTQPVDLNLFRKVLKERHVLREIADKLRQKIQKGLKKLEKLKAEEKRLEMIESKVELNKRHTYVLKQETKNVIWAKPGQVTNYCERCNITCCSNCFYSDDNDKMKCSVMENEQCTFCPRKCAWLFHKNKPFVVTVHAEDVIQTSEEMKNKYEKAEAKRRIVRQDITELREEFEEIQMDTEALMQQARTSQDTLDRTALRPRVTSDVEYIEMLIRNELLSQEENGKHDRLLQLSDAKVKAKYLSEMLENDFDPFKKCPTKGSKGSAEKIGH